MDKKVFEIEVTETIVRKIQVVADDREQAFDKYLDMDKNAWRNWSIDPKIIYTKSYEEITNHMKHIGTFIEHCDEEDEDDIHYSPNSGNIKIRI